MLAVTVSINHLTHGCVTDERPFVSFALTSDVAGEALEATTVRCGDWSTTTTHQLGIPVEVDLAPHTTYTVTVEATGTSGERATGTARFTTGKVAEPWQARWIRNGAYTCADGESPVPTVFATTVELDDTPVERAWVHASALGIYTAELNGQQISDAYFAPGFTSYAHTIQYQTYDVTSLVRPGTNTICATVAGGWAVGSFSLRRKSKISADQCALLLELHLQLADGTHRVIATNDAWQVTQDGPVRAAEFYDGETYDARRSLDAASWHAATLTAPREHPALVCDAGLPVVPHEARSPISVTRVPSGEVVYDFGQNMAGVVRLSVRGHAGQTIVLRHAEVLNGGELFVNSLRSAKATATYTCTDGTQTWTPRFTYMGFRYVGLTGADPADVELEAVPLYSDFATTGSFSCSNDDINQLQSNIVWGGRSNFVDIPTDCPQRDEREGWTGDATVFAQTACFNFDLARFYDKWLRDMVSEQGRGGGIPMVIPQGGDDAWPVMATACWGDACIMVPWAVWLSRGDLEVLRRCYPMMLKFLQAARWWSRFLSIRPNRREIWRWPFHFGDWCAPEGNVIDWTQKGRWVATAYRAASLGIVSHVATLLGDAPTARELQAERERVIAAYRKVFTNGHGKLKREFQTAYVLPLYFGMTEGTETQAMADNLARLVRDNGHKLSTGFTGTPYLLFALSDHGHVDEAYRVLLQTACPSWLYEVRAGATTIWERWDALRPDGTVNTDSLTGKKDDGENSMVSFNHYANGAVGDWLYRRMVGLEPTDGGWRTFTLRPLPGGDITWAKATEETPYGLVAASWRIEDGTFALDVQVPVSSTCTCTLPDGSTRELTSGTHHLSCPFAAAERS